MTRLLAVLCLLLASACGTTGEPEGRPIELLYYVTGFEGQQFEIVTDAAGCDAPPGQYAAPIMGIQAPNAQHLLTGRVFETPRLFVLENTRQPVRAAFRNLSLTAPITVNLYLGFTQAVGGDAGTIPPLGCKVIQSDDTVSLTPKPRGPDTQIEVCSPDGGNHISCLDNTTSTDRNLFFFASLGDLEQANITNCTLSPILDNCQTPVTFFVQNPVDQIDAVMSVNPGQDAPPAPKPVVRAELYINGTLVDADYDANATVTHNF
ncbi:MAG: hypothetical protein SF182_09250 [Deltaproteobacteria bacterium]|nr:hypothetical protein [Deltaproteobacteria bacterium]